MMPISELAKVLREYGLPDVLEGATIPGGLSFKVLPNGSMRLSWMEPHKRLIVTIDSEGRIERAEILQTVPRADIIVNGMQHLVVGGQVGVHHIAALAGMDPKLGLTVTWSMKDRQAFGTLVGERKIDVEDGMVFNCYHTGNA